LGVLVVGGSCKTIRLTQSYEAGGMRNEIKLRKKYQHLRGTDR
jgi:hypothetical protein